MLGYKGVREFEDTHSKPHVLVRFINTYSGVKFNLEETSPADVFIEDIAHALSQICRFNGHTNMFYSVAQHSMLVSEKLPGDPSDKLAALMHDAAEAYVCDIPSPIKPFLGEGYRHLFATVQAVIHERFRIGRTPSQVALYDKAAVVYEAQAFFGYSLDELECHGYDSSVCGLWQPWDPRQFASDTCDEEMGMVAAEFIRRFEELMKVCRKGELV